MDQLMQNSIENSSDIKISAYILYTAHAIKYTLPYN